MAAEARGAFDEALGAVEAHQGGRAPGSRGPTRVRRHDLLLRLATARQRMGDMAGARRARRGGPLARPLDDHVRMAEAVTSFRSSGVWHWREMGNADPGDRRGAGVPRPRRGPGLQARLWANLGMEYYVGGAPRRPTGAATVARAGPGHGDPQVLRDCLAARVVAWFPGKPTSARPGPGVAGWG